MPLTGQRAVANVRERKRTQKLNQAYRQLQAKIPKEPSDKMSKIHTLKLAISYIYFLNDLLGQQESSIDDTKASHVATNAVSPCPSYSGRYAQGSSANVTSEEEDECLHHRSKRARRHDQQQPIAAIIPSPTSSLESNATCYNNQFSFAPSHLEEALQVTPSYTNYYTDSSEHLTSPTIYQYNTNPQDHNPQGHQSSQVTVSLRSAFREYRSNKRKIFI